MNKKILKEQGKKERTQTLKDNAIRSEIYEYSKEYTEDELLTLKEKYIQADIKIQKEEEILKAAKDACNVVVNPIKVEKRDILSGLKHKSRMVTEEVYLLADHKEGMIEYITEEGEVVFSRKMLPDEKQLRIELSKTGTED